jgi:thiol-disulfide isomerase/thioredoxin
METLRRTAVLILVGAVVLTPSLPVAGEDPPPNSPSVGDVVPAFDAQRIDGTTQKVSFPKGSTTVLLFFLSGCPTCHKMIP